MHDTFIDQQTRPKPPETPKNASNQMVPMLLRELASYVADELKLSEDEQVPFGRLNLFITGYMGEMRKRHAGRKQASREAARVGMDNFYAHRSDF